MFDPFGDFETKGYLRNHEGQKDPAKIKELEHRSFLINLDDATTYLNRKKTITFEDVKKVHKILFQDVYPWAGTSRDVNTPNLHITKGDVEFQYAPFVRRGIEYSLQQASQPDFMRKKPGEIMGNLAYAHPFLDGNGRTLLIVHSELCRRADMHIEWGKTTKEEYLKALTQEIHEPKKGHLDNYLAPFVVNKKLSLDADARSLQTLRGLASEESFTQEKKYSKTELIQILSERKSELSLTNAQIKKFTKLIKEHNHDNQKNNDAELER